MNLERYRHDPVAFIDDHIRLNEKSKPWHLGSTGELRAHAGRTRPESHRHPGGAAVTNEEEKA